MRRITEEELRDAAKRRPAAAAYVRRFLEKQDQLKAQSSKPGQQQAASPAPDTEPATNPPETPNTSTGQQ